LVCETNTHPVMKPLFLVMALALAVSCGQKNKPVDEISPSFEEAMAPFHREFAAIDSEYDAAGDQRKLELEARYEELELEMVEAQKKYIRTYPASANSIAALVDIDWSFTSASEFRSYLDVIDTSLHNYPEYINLDNLVDQMERVEEGKTAPDFTMPDTDGHLVSLSELCRQSDYLLVDFWASTCGPCRAENPNIRKAYFAFQTKGFNVLGISTDTRKEAWLEAVSADSLPWINLCSLEPWNDNPVVRDYALRQVSQNFLLDSTGKIISRDLRGEDLHRMLATLMD